MSVAPAFQTASSSSLYQTSAAVNEQDQTRIAMLTKLARLMPPVLTDNIKFEELREITLELGAIKGPTGLGRGFAAAFADFSKIATATNGVDGTGGAIPRGDAYNSLLDGFEAFHTAQKTLRPTEEAVRLFHDMRKARQTYWDMQDSGVAATTYGSGKLHHGRTRVAPR